MGQYAKVREGKVVEVIVASEDFIKEYVDDSPGKWVRTSYNIRGGDYYEPNHAKKASNQGLINDDEGRKRKNFAGIGYIYDNVKDAFTPPKPHDSWTLNSTTHQWEAPTAYPSDNKQYKWDETSKKWVERDA